MKLWEVATGRCLRTFEGHAKCVTFVCMSADDRYALSGSRDMTLKLWEVATGRCLHTYGGSLNGLWPSCLSVDGRYALSGGEKFLGGSHQTFNLWEVATGRRVRTFEERTDGYWSVLCLSTDGRYALSAGHGIMLKLWELATGRCLRTFEGHGWGVNSACLSVDGRYALSGGNDGTLKLWEVATGRCLRTFEGHAGPVHSVCLSADGQRALSGSSDNTMKLWGVATGRCLRTFEGHTGLVSEVFLSADGRYALSKSYDKTLKLWICDSISILAPLAVSQGEATRKMVAARAGYRRALTAARQALVEYDVVAAWKYLRTARSQSGYRRADDVLEEWSHLYVRLRKKSVQDAWVKGSLVGVEVGFQVRLTSDGRYVLSGDGDKTMTLWEVATGRCLRTFEGHVNSVSSVCLSTDGRCALSGSYDKTLKLWEVATGHCLSTFEGHMDYVESVCLSADGRYALSGSRDKTLKLWEVARGRCLRTFEGHTSDVNSVCLSTDGRCGLSGSYDKTLRLWEVASGRCLRTFEGHASSVDSVCLSVDGRYALSGSGDKTLKLWEVATGCCLRTFEGHTSYVTSVCLSLDGTHALSGSDDGTLKMWELATGCCLRTFEGHAHTVTSVCMSADGRYVLSGLRAHGIMGIHEKTLNVWFLDWELEANQPVDWDEGARPYLEVFLATHQPYAGELPADRTPTDEELVQALTRKGRPVWTEDDFSQFLYTLGCAGYGWLRPEGVRRELEKMSADLRRVCWNVQQLFRDPKNSVGISCAGQISTQPASGNPHAVEIYDIHHSGPTGLIHLSVARNADAIPARFGWRVDSRYLVVATSGGQGPYELQLLDVSEHQTVGSVGPISKEVFTLEWSPRGSYLGACCMLQGQNADVDLWRFEEGQLRHTSGFRFDSATEYLLGCRALAFSSDERTLLVVAEVGIKAKNVFAHWDELFVLDLPTLRLLRRLNPPATVCGLSWGEKQQQVVMNCTYGKTFLVSVQDANVTPLPFIAGMCCCHPTDVHLCAFADRGNLVVGDLEAGSIIAQHPLGEDEIDSLAMCWSNNGERLFAASGLGRSYTYVL
jgi:WD40 repeat protein